MDTTVLAVFDSRAETQRTVADLLREATVRREDITVVPPDPTERGLADPLADADRSQLIADLVEVGALGGTVAGALIGGLASLGAHALHLPAALHASESVAVALGGAAIGALAGMAALSLLGGLMAMVTTDAQAHVYGEAMQPGATLLGVVAHAGQVAQVETILRQHGARRIEERRGAWRRPKRRGA